MPKKQYQPEKSINEQGGICQAPEIPLPKAPTCTKKIPTPCVPLLMTGNIRCHRPGEEREQDRPLPCEGGWAKNGMV